MSDPSPQKKIYVTPDAVCIPLATPQGLVATHASMNDCIRALKIASDGFLIANTGHRVDQQGNPYLCWHIHTCNPIKTDDGMPTLAPMLHGDRTRSGTKEPPQDKARTLKEFLERRYYFHLGQGVDKDTLETTAMALAINDLASLMDASSPKHSPLRLQIGAQGSALSGNHSRATKIHYLQNPPCMGYKP